MQRISEEGWEGWHELVRTINYISLVESVYKYVLMKRIKAGFKSQGFLFPAGYIADRLEKSDEVHLFIWRPPHQRSHA